MVPAVTGVPQSQSAPNAISASGNDASSPFAKLLAALPEKSAGIDRPSGPPNPASGASDVSPQDTLAEIANSVDALGGDGADVTAWLEQLGLPEGFLRELADLLAGVTGDSIALQTSSDTIIARLAALQAETGAVGGAVPNSVATDLNGAPLADVATELSELLARLQQTVSQPGTAQGTPPATPTNAQIDLAQAGPPALLPHRTAGQLVDGTQVPNDGLDIDGVLSDEIVEGPRRVLGQQANTDGPAALTAFTALKTSGLAAPSPANAGQAAIDALTQALAPPQETAQRGAATDLMALLQAMDPAAQARAMTAQAGQTNAAATGAQVPIETLAVTIYREAQNGQRRFEIQLDPPELGRIDVRLEMGRDGRVQTHLMVERPETLDQLVRDARQLERALSQAGMKLDEQSLQFSLKDQGGGQQQGFANHDDTQSPTWRDGLPNADPQTIEAIAEIRLPVSAGLDMRI
ncbi:MAG: flagellar hook-length control protein FliK [Pseudomonadota bacterium]